MKDNQLPLVSIPVIAYNSSKTIVETLDSIFYQTYPNLELIVSDDGSTDNTVQVCREWIEAHKDRFVRVELLTVEKNTGISANMNRAEKVCRGEWVKGIAGDDFLLPECIETYMLFVFEHPNAKLVFSKLKCFGVSESQCKERESMVDYSFFDLTPEEQMHYLMFEGNGLSAPSVFYKFGMQVTCDERIPLLEDWPRWINYLKANVKFDFIDKQLVCYRVNDKLSKNAKYMESLLLFNLYYRYPVWKEECPDDAERMLADTLKETFVDASDVDRVYHTRSYLLGKTILRPVNWIKKLLNIRK